MQCDGLSWRKQNNYDEMPRAPSVIAKQTADVLSDPGQELSALTRRLDQIVNQWGPLLPG